MQSNKNILFVLLISGSVNAMENFNFVWNFKVKESATNDEITPVAVDSLSEVKEKEENPINLIDVNRI